MTGPDPETLLPPVPIETLRGEALSSIQELARRFLAEVDQPIRWFNTRFGQSFAVLTCCRMFQTSISGSVQSNSAVKWAEHFVDPEWRELIRGAWVERRGARFGDKVRQPAGTKVMHETAKFLDYAVNLAETSRDKSRLTRQSVKFVRLRIGQRFAKGNFLSGGENRQSSDWRSQRRD